MAGPALRCCTPLASHENEPQPEGLMPSSWSRKDERMYEHIKEGYEERGASGERAEEIAARTVNKGRREEGRTANASTSGTGNPNTPLESRTKDELENVAAKEDVEGRSRMSKSELVDAIRRKRS
jgi:hypothetical protein